MNDYLYLLVGFVVLLVSGDFLVRGGVSIARHFKISTLVVGLTVVSLGTSAPELVVSLKAVLNGDSDVSMGTIIGSNISNMALVLGLTALILPIAVNGRSTRVDWPIMFGATLVFYFLILNGYLDRWEGLLFVALLVIYIVYTLVQSRSAEKKSLVSTLSPKYSVWLSLLIVVVSVVGLRFGAGWLVDGATGVAEKLGVSDYLISVTVLAFGTSVPELATSLIAAFKKEMDISVGNIIGSNLFNILGILGVTASVKAIQVNSQILSFDIFILLGICVLLLVFMLPLKKGIIKRWQGGVLLLSYVGYTLIKIYTDQV